MTEGNKSLSPSLDRSDSQAGSGDSLSEAQRSFAQLLGRLLAHRWQEEHYPASPSNPGNDDTKKESLT